MTFCANKKSPWRRFFFIFSPLVGPFAAIRPSPSPCRCFVLMGIALVAWCFGVWRGPNKNKNGREKKNPFGSDVGPSPFNRARPTDRNEATSAKWRAESAILDKVQCAILWVELLKLQPRGFFGSVSAASLFFFFLFCSPVSNFMHVCCWLALHAASRSANGGSSVSYLILQAARRKAYM